MADLLRRLALEAGVIAAALYFGGWLYLNRYYSVFQIDIGLLELGWHEIVIHAAALIRNAVSMLMDTGHFIWILLMFVVALFMPDQIAVKQKTEWLGLWNTKLVLPALLVVLTLVGFVKLIDNVAVWTAKRDWATFNQIIVLNLKGQDCSSDLHLVSANEKKSLKLLKASRNWYFVAVPAELRTRTELGDLKVFHVPVTCINSVRMPLPGTF